MNIERMFRDEINCYNALSGPIIESRGLQKIWHGRTIEDSFKNIAFNALCSIAAASVVFGSVSLFGFLISYAAIKYIRVEVLKNDGNNGLHYQWKNFLNQVS